MRSQPAKLRANSTSLGSAWISTESKKFSKISTDSETRCGEAERRTTSRTEDTIRGRGFIAFAASRSGSSSERFVGRAQRRQLMKARGAQGQARDRRAARHQQHVEAAFRQGPRQGGGAAQMADA